MGTRNLTCVRINGEYRLAQYGQWDGAPHGQGQVALEFLRKMDESRFLEKLAAARFVGRDTLDRWYADAGADHPTMVSFEVYYRVAKDHPVINRDLGAKVLELIETSEAPLELYNDIDFAADGSGLCEWAYLIDFDRRTFEVYRPACLRPDKNTPHAGLPLPKPNEDGERYCFMQRVAEFSLDKLPSTEVFLAKAAPKKRAA
jgi:hypothetical protein